MLVIWAGGPEFVMDKGKVSSNVPMECALSALFGTSSRRNEMAMDSVGNLS